MGKSMGYPVAANWKDPPCDMLGKSTNEMAMFSSKLSNSMAIEAMVND
jgi:hypothetical protein